MEVSSSNGNNGFHVTAMMVSEKVHFLKIEITRSHGVSEEGLFESNRKLFSDLTSTLKSITFTDLFESSLESVTCNMYYTLPGLSHFVVYAETCTDLEKFLFLILLHPQSLSTIVVMPYPDSGSAFIDRENRHAQQSGLESPNPQSQP